MGNWKALFVSVFSTLLWDAALFLRLQKMLQLLIKMEALL